MMSARTSQANPTKSTMKNAVPSVVAAMLKNRECGTLFISLPMLIQSVHLAPDDAPIDFRESWLTSNF
jgi:hypothetical protein